MKRTGVWPEAFAALISRFSRSEIDATTNSLRSGGCRCPRQALEQGSSPETVFTGGHACAVGPQTVWRWRGFTPSRPRESWSLLFGPALVILCSIADSLLVGPSLRDRMLRSC